MTGDKSVLLVIEGKLPGLNEYVSACRSNPHAGAAMKKKTEKNIRYQLKAYHEDIDHGISGAYIKFVWYEDNKRRDKDNIAFAKKFILDALVTEGILADDGWNGVAGFTDMFFVDKGEARVEVIIGYSQSRLSG